mmetsp:Transcript_1474/g.4331  ORF Transcript_1474/g.4331 Transcript_1474/m.4331 type:complete len:385 (-) Transcript_1474:191-1345(-)
MARARRAASSGRRSTRSSTHDCASSRPTRSATRAGGCTFWTRLVFDGDDDDSFEAEAFFSCVVSWSSSEWLRSVRTRFSKTRGGSMSLRPRASRSSTTNSSTSKLAALAKRTDHFLFVDSSSSATWNSARSKRRLRASFREARACSRAQRAAWSVATATSLLARSDKSKAYSAASSKTVLSSVLERSRASASDAAVVSSDHRLFLFFGDDVPAGAAAFVAVAVLATSTHSSSSESLFWKNTRCTNPGGFVSGVGVSSKSSMLSEEEAPTSLYELSSVSGSSAMRFLRAKNSTFSVPSLRRISTRRSLRTRAFSISTTRRLHTLLKSILKEARETRTASVFVAVSFLLLTAKPRSRQVSTATPSKSMRPLATHTDSVAMRTRVSQ